VESEVRNTQSAIDQIVQFGVVDVVDTASATTGNDVVDLVDIRGVSDVLEVVIVCAEQQLHSETLSDRQHLTM